MPPKSEQQRFLEPEGLAFLVAVWFCVLACVFLTGSYVSRCCQKACIALDSRVNPNEAPLASLVRLPGIGQARAEAIVAYRRQMTAETGRAAFSDCADLEKVKGIGPKTMEGLCRYLKFE